MIVDKRLPGDEEEESLPSDAPPAYDALVSSGEVSRTFDRDQKLLPLPPLESSHSPLSPGSPGAGSSNLKSPTPSLGASKGKAKSTNWFNFLPSSRTTREVRSTVLRLVRDLVQETLANSPAATSVLQSCADACAAHDVSLSDILQEKSIENHTPIYWGIVKRPPDDHQENDVHGPDLLTAIISFSSPLKPETISEIRLACLATSDQKLFQRLRMSPEFAPLSGSDQMLLGGAIPPDEIEVEGYPEMEGSFAVSFEVPQFHKRMVVSKEVVLEFIARNRLWRLSFFIASEQRISGTGPRPGSWCVSLSLLETSPPTFLDGHLLIPEAMQSAHSSSSDRPTSPKASPFSLPQASKAKPTISLRLKSTERLEPPRKGYQGKFILVSLEDSVMGANLQYGDTTYIGADEKLRARLEVKLGKPESECIIC